jgi:DNA-binding response OmpR family regulator
MARPSLAPDSPEILLVIANEELRAALADVLRVDGFATRTVSAVADAREGIVCGRPPVAMIVDAALGWSDVRRLVEELTRDGAAPPTVLVVQRAELSREARDLGVGCVEIPFGHFALVQELARVREQSVARPSSA